jgi:hypothetical protein
MKMLTAGGNEQYQLSIKQIALAPKIVLDRSFSSLGDLFS